MGLLPEAVTAGTAGHVTHSNQIHQKLNAYIDVCADYGAVGDGTTDDTAAINNALAAIPVTGGEVFLPEGIYKITSPLLITAHNTTLRGAGAGQQTGGSQSAMGSRIEVGTGFTGSHAILVQATGGATTVPPLYGVQLQDFALDGRNVAGPINGIMYRSNRGLIRHVMVYRMTGNGIVVKGYVLAQGDSADWDTYDTNIVYSQVSMCGASAVYLDHGSADGHLMGCVLFDSVYNLTVKGGSSWQITANHFYDAGTDNIKFDGGGSRTKIIGNKIEGGGSSGINIDSTNGGYSDIQIIGNGITTNGDAGVNTGDNIIIQGPSGNGITRTQIIGNNIGYKSGITNFTRYGVNFASTASQNAIVMGNTFNGASMTAFVNGVGSGSSPAKIRHNIGWITESSGTATVANGTTSIAVTHGLSKTPALQDIQVTPTNNMGNSAKYWISNPTSTQFTINVNADPGATTATFAWYASIL